MNDYHRADGIGILALIRATRTCSLFANGTLFVLTFISGLTKLDLEVVLTTSVALIDRCPSET